MKIANKGMVKINRRGFRIGIKIDFKITSLALNG